MSALRTAGLAIAALGAAIAAYLVYVHYGDVTPLCQFGRGCQTVQASEYASLAGVPVALLGLVAYLLTGAALWYDRGPARAAAALTALAGAGFSAYLTYLEVATIRAICQWCVASALLMAALAALTTVRLAAGGDPGYRVRGMRRC